MFRGRRWAAAWALGGLCGCTDPETRESVAAADVAAPDAAVKDDAARDDAALGSATDAGMVNDPPSPFWACPELDCERDIPDAPEGAPMVCDVFGEPLYCDLGRPSCDLRDCEACDLGECTVEFAAASPDGRMKACFDCPVTHFDVDPFGEPLYSCDDETGARIFVDPFRWCRFDERGRMVEAGDWYEGSSSTYVYDAAGRVVAGRYTGTEDNGWKQWEGSTCRYDEGGRVSATTQYYVEQDDAGSSHVYNDCIRYDASGRVLGRESAIYGFGYVDAGRCVLSAKPGTCAACDLPDTQQAADACAEELTAAFSF